MRPYIITHMMTSIDGRIACPMVGQLSTDEYYIALARLGACSKLSGRVTAELECPAVDSENEVSYSGKPYMKESFHITVKSEEYSIVVDSRGILNWKSNEADGHPVLCITSGNAPEDYITRLRELGISYIVSGISHIDMPRAMGILHDNFGVERLAIVGGGNTCGSFLNNGLVDEVSLMIAPGIDGRKGETAVFDGITGRGCKPYKLKLQSVEQWDTDILWIRYTLLK